jgi:hypothetical protein
MLIYWRVSCIHIVNIVVINCDLSPFYIWAGHGRSEKWIKMVPPLMALSIGKVMINPWINMSPYFQTISLYLSPLRLRGNRI